MAQPARNAAEKDTNVARATASNVAEMNKRATKEGATIAREGGERAGEAVRDSFEATQRTAAAVMEVQRTVARHSADGVAELNQAFVDLLNQQTRDGIDALRELTGAVDWNTVARIQGEFLRASLERSAEFTRRYFEVLQSVMASAASAPEEQTRKAA